VAYQIAGLAIACAAGVAAVRLSLARGAARLAWGALVLVLAVAVLLPGGRAAFLALVAVVALAPALRLALAGRAERAFLWLVLVAAAGFAGLGLLLLDPARADQLATLERLLRAQGDTPSAREILWSEALRLGGVMGLGPGAFPAAIGVGNDRGFHPHNHALEALTEGGLVGLALWGGAFLGATFVALRAARRVDPARVAEVFAIAFPVAISAMVSTDLGNRMMWFALGFALSLAAETRARPVARLV
jgi:O-antigen ligase